MKINDLFKLILIIVGMILISNQHIATGLTMVIISLVYAFIDPNEKR